MQQAALAIKAGGDGGKGISLDVRTRRGEMELRPVKYWTKSRDEERGGFFHVWGSRNDEYLSETFGVVEDKETGQCLELDPIQIRFTDR